MISRLFHDPSLGHRSTKNQGKFSVPALCMSSTAKANIRSSLSLSLTLHSASPPFPSLPALPQITTNLPLPPPDSAPITLPLLFQPCLFTFQHPLKLSNLNPFCVRTQELDKAWSQRTNCAGSLGCYSAPKATAEKCYFPPPPHVQLMPRTLRSAFVRLK